MVESFVSRKDRIIASAIEIISESGLSALTTRNLATKENMSEALQLQHTFKSREGAYVQRIKDYLDAYATYYDNYYAISTLMLHYEELLHNADVREKIAWCITERMNFMADLFKGAIDEGEIIGLLTPEQLATSVTGEIMAHILNRRIVYHKKTFKQDLMSTIDKWFELLKKDK